MEFIKKSAPKISLETCHIESIYDICLKNGKTNLPEDNHCIVTNGKLTILLKENLGKTVSFSVKISEKKKKVNNLLLNCSIDCDRIVGKLEIRSRKSGDSIRLANRGCTKPLTKLYNEYNIPLNLRDTLPVISDDKGVVWIYGIGVAERCAVKDKTKLIYLIEVEENEK